MQYYYGHLNKQEQAVYLAMLEGFRQVSPSFPVLRLENESLAKAYAFLRMDHPELFYLTGYRYRYYQDSVYCDLLPEYMFEKKKVLDHRKALEARISKLVRPAQNMKEIDKLKYIHDFICSNITYDKLKKPYSHEIIGPLGHGVGVCEGIAKSVKILCDELGIWCVPAICHNNPEKGIKYRHMWNIVKINGTYYHFDATFDNTLGTPEMHRYDYFMLSDEQIFKDHEPLLYPIVSCTDGTHTYYREKKLSFTKDEEVQKRCLQAAKRGKVLDFQWRGGGMSYAVLKNLVQIIEEEASKKDKHALVSMNRTQAILRVSFVPVKPEESIVEQNANEAEQEIIEQK